MKLGKSITDPRFFLGFITFISPIIAQRIKGFWRKLDNGGFYMSYEGIPYAKPPIGDLRFEPPQPYDKWPVPGVTFIGKEVGFNCLQWDPSEYIVRGREDCLFLNVYKPDKERINKDIPVIFFIHGPDFQTGSGAIYKPKYILEQDVMLVTFNYRLGAYGFLCTEDDVVPGNMGLKDQVLALQWVKDNINWFGGNPNNITIIGHGAGGASVHYHYMTPKTKNLFKQGMSMSGTALSPWAQAKGSLEKAKLLGKAMLCPIVNTRMMINCLKNLTADYIVFASLPFRTFHNTPYAPFGPVIEKPNPTALITESPMDTILSGKAHDLPWITGVVGAEGLCVMAGIVANNSAIEKLGDDWEKIAPEMLDFNYTLPEWRQVRAANWIRKEYVGRWSFTAATINPTVLMVSDRMFNDDAVLAARLHAKMGKSPVRFYRFGYRGLHSYSEIASGSSRNFGVAHMDDLAYLFDLSISLSIRKTDRQMRTSLISLWVSYARSYDSTPDLGFGWPQISKTDPDSYFLNILGPHEMKASTIKDTIGRIEFWQSLGITEDPLLKDPDRPKRTAERTFWYENQIVPCNGTEITLTD